MPEPSLKERVRSLEQQVAELQALVQRKRLKDWRRTIGMFAGDEIMERIFAGAMELREKDRKKVAPRRGKQKPNS